MKVLALVALGHTASGGAPVRAAVDFRADIQPATRLVVESTPIGLVVAAEQHHAEPGADVPTIIVPAGTPLLAATGVNVWHEEWLAPGLLLAGVL